VAGLHNVKNSLAAAACALAVGAPLPVIAQGLASFQPVAGRSRTLALSLAGRDITLVDDSYNANPDSVLAAIDVLAGLPGPRLLVLGDMGEVGSQGPQFHTEIGAYARQRGIEDFFALGEQTRHSVQAYGGGSHFADIEALNQAVRDKFVQSGQRAGQGLALHEDGAGGAISRQPGRHPARRSPCCLVWRNGCSRSRLNLGFSGFFSTSLSVL